MFANIPLLARHKLGNPQDNSLDDIHNFLDIFHTKNYCKYKHLTH